MSAWLVINGSSEFFVSLKEATAALELALNARLKKGWAINPPLNSKNPWQRYIAKDPSNGFEEIFITDDISGLQS